MACLTNPVESKNAGIEKVDVWIVGLEKQRKLFGISSH